jgi:hypothetical protein
MVTDYSEGPWDRGNPCRRLAELGGGWPGRVGAGDVRGNGPVEPVTEAGLLCPGWGSHGGRVAVPMRNLADSCVAYMPVVALGFGAAGGSRFSIASVDVNIGARRLIPGNRTVSILAGASAIVSASTWLAGTMAMASKNSLAAQVPNRRGRP